MNTPMMTVRLTVEVRERLDKIAATKGCTRSEVLREAILSYIRTQGEQ